MGNRSHRLWKLFLLDIYKNQCDSHCICVLFIHGVLYFCLIWNAEKTQACKDCIGFQISKKCFMALKFPGTEYFNVLKILLLSLMFCILATINATAYKLSGHIVCATCPWLIPAVGALVLDRAFVRASSENIPHRVRCNILM